MLTRASQPELVRSNQKDEFYTSYLREQIGQIFRDVKGPHLWIRWKKELELFADLCYFGLTTVCGFQTLGEEYCNIVQVDGTRRAIPSTPAVRNQKNLQHLRPAKLQDSKDPAPQTVFKERRTFLVVLHVLGPYILEKLLARLEQRYRVDDQMQQAQHSLWKQLLYSVIPALRQTVTVIHRTHLAVFYLTGMFYHIAKRITVVQYLLVRSSIKDVGSRPSYRLLGYLSLLQLSISLLLALYQKSFSANTLDRRDFDGSGKTRTLGQTANISRLKCPLCLEQLKNMTATPCGHLFCWYCIAEWCSSKAECPLCRENVQLSRLVCLQYFEPT